MKKSLILLFLSFLAFAVHAQDKKELPPLHVEGKWLVTDEGKHMVLHGVMDTPSTYFNGGRWQGSKARGWWDDYNDTGVTNCLVYFEKLFRGLEQAKCDVFRLHMDPAWTNDPDKQSDGKESGEADISRFSKTRYEYFLPRIYLKLAQRAMNHGMYVVVRPPGVCPGNLKVGDYYQEYLMYVWDIFSQQDFVKEHAGQISIELANEPVNLRNKNGADDPKALHDYFQPIVDKIRENGFTGIIWAPGTGWQSNYQSYAKYPIEGENIGYAVHDYCGWYGCSDDTPSPQNLIRQFRSQVPVVDKYPIIITEVDWSPAKPGSGHYNEHGDWVESNYGTWATGSTSKWGRAYKAMLDHYKNISMTLSGTACLIDIDILMRTGKASPAFGGLEEACGKACMDWYAVYYEANWGEGGDDNNDDEDDQMSIDKLGSYVSVAEIESSPFVIVSEDKKAFYGSDNQNLGFEDANTVLNDISIVGYRFKAEPVAGTDGHYLLRLIQLDGSEYNIWGKPGYLNSQPASGWCSFILGLNNQMGEDMANGAEWEIRYVEGKGFTLRNVGTGLYLKDASPAKYDEPSYFNFMVEKEFTSILTAKDDVKGDDAIYTLDGRRVSSDRLQPGIYIKQGKKYFYSGRSR
jgi:hypothetical protein